MKEICQKWLRFVGIANETYISNCIWLLFATWNIKTEV